MHSCTSRASLELGSLITIILSYLSTLSSNALMKVWYCIVSPMKDGRLILGPWSTPISVSRLLAVFSPVLLARLLSLMGSRSLTISPRLGVSNRGLWGCGPTEWTGCGSIYTSCAWVLDRLGGVSSLLTLWLFAVGVLRGVSNSAILYEPWRGLDVLGGSTWMPGVSIEWREARFLLERAIFSWRGEEGSSGLTLARMGGPFRSIPQSYWVVTGGSVQLVKLDSCWVAGLSFLLDRWVKLGSSHWRGAVFIFSSAGTLVLISSSTGRLGSVQSFRTLSSIFSLARSLGSVQSFGMLCSIFSLARRLGSVQSFGSLCSIFSLAGRRGSAQSSGTLCSIFSLDGDLRLIRSSAGRLGWRDCSPARVVSPDVLVLVGEFVEPPGGVLSGSLSDPGPSPVPSPLLRILGCARGLWFSCLIWGGQCGTSWLPWSASRLLHPGRVLVGWGEIEHCYHGQHYPRLARTRPCRRSLSLPLALSSCGLQAPSDSLPSTQGLTFG